MTALLVFLLNRDFGLFIVLKKVNGAAYLFFNLRGMLPITLYYACLEGVASTQLSVSQQA